MKRDKWKWAAVFGVLFCMAGHQVLAAESEVSLTVLLRYDFKIPDDFEQVADAVDHHVQEKIGVSVKLVPLLPSSLEQEVGLLHKNGIKIDVTSELCGTFDYLALDGLLEEYGTDVLRIASEKELEMTRMDGELYSLPSKADCAASAGIAMRSDILEKYHIDAKELHSLEDIEKSFEIVSAGEPKLHMVTPLWSTKSFFMRFKLFDAIPNTIFDIARRDETQVINYYRTEDYREKLKMFRKWYLKGYFPEEMPLQQIKGSERVKAGELFSYFCACKPGIEWEESTSSGCEMTVIPLEEPCITNRSVRISPWGILKESEHPEESMQFLNLLYSDAELANLLAYGIENEHYVVLENGCIDYPEDIDFRNSGYSPNIGWSLPNQLLTYVWNGNDPDLWEQTIQYEENARMAYSLGFVFDPFRVQLQNQELTRIADQYSYGLECGMLDPEVYLPMMLGEMEEAGEAQVLEEVQRQYQEWRNAGK